MKTKSIVIFAAYLLMANPSWANLITNGDFESCSFQNWTTDNVADPGFVGTPESPFSIANDGSNCSAQLYVDDGMTTDSFLAALISQELDLTANDGDTLTLSFDYDFFGNDGDPVFGDFVQFGFEDASGLLFDPSDNQSFLIPEIAGYGNDTISMELDPVYFNQTGWFLRFDLFDQFNGGTSSTLNLDNISLIRTPAQVNSPALGSLFAISLLFVLYGRRKSAVLSATKGK